MCGPPLCTVGKRVRNNGGVRGDCGDAALAGPCLRAGEYCRGRSRAGDDPAGDGLEAPDRRDVRRSRGARAAGLHAAGANSDPAGGGAGARIGRAVTVSRARFAESGARNDAARAAVWLDHLVDRPCDLDRREEACATAGKVVDIRRSRPDAVRRYTAMSRDG